MAKTKLSTSYTNGLLTKENGKYIIEEFDTKGEVSKGKYILSDALDQLLDHDGIKLSFDITNELEPNL